MDMLTGTGDGNMLAYAIAKDNLKYIFIHSQDSGITRYLFDKMLDKGKDFSKGRKLSGD
ncbi:MAG: hypothetical protein HUJ74_02850 [Lachnospiraceae bacterium]|nr:hypothetical protein [Lachnospiraceae bacterium]